MHITASSTDSSAIDATSPAHAHIHAQATLAVPATPVSAGWLIRRTALWMLLVGLGVAGACLLYVAASEAEAESLSRNAQASGLSSHSIPR